MVSADAKQSDPTQFCTLYRNLGGLMVTMREIVTDWTGPQGSGMSTVMFFESTPTIASQRASIGTFLTSYKANIANTWSYAVRTTGRNLDSGTGALVGSWSEPTATVGTGGVATQPLPDAAQVLYQWRTPTIVNGRFLRGRTFLPGLTASSLTNGNITAGVVTGLTSYGTTFVGAATAFGVWHRPIGGGGGTHVVASACTVWPELAVLRRRRK